MGHQPCRSTTAERTWKTLAAGVVQAGACRVASVGRSVRERLAQRSGAANPIPVELPAGSPVLGAEAEVHHYCRRFPGLTMRRRESPRRSHFASARRFTPSNCRRLTDVHAAGRVGRRRQGDVRESTIRVRTYGRRASFSFPMRVRAALPPRRSGSPRGERRSEVHQPAQNPARTGR